MFTTGLSQKFTIVDKCNIVNFKRIKKFSKSTSNFNKINFVIKTYRLDSYFFSYYPYIGSNGESAHLGLLLYEFMKESEQMLQYFQFPKFLLKLSISQNAKFLYMVLYDRARISRKNSSIDKYGNVF